MNKPISNNLNLFVLASSQLIGSEGMPVGFAFRNSPEGKEDSGWNFWSGEETEEFIESPHNFAKYPLKDFISLDGSLKQIIDAKVGTAWERDPESDAWIEVEED